MADDVSSVSQSLLSGQISFTGLGSGTDFQSMIEQLIKVEGIQKQRLELWKETWELKIEGFNYLSTSLLSLKSTMEGMDTINEFLAKTASSSNDSVLTATAGSDAHEGSHTIEVNQLAQNAIITWDTGFDSKDAVVTSSAMTLALDYMSGADQKDFDITIAPGITMESLVATINNHPDNPGIRASMVHNGDQYYLQIRGMDQGADYTVSVDDANTTLPGAGSANWQINQTAQSAQIRVDGYPNDPDWIEIDGNRVEDVIEGMTFTLKDTGTVTVAVGTDTAAVKESIYTFVEKVNEVRNMVIQLTDFDETETEGSVLTGNYGVQLLSSNLKNATSGKALGFSYWDTDTEQGNLYTSLSQIGITTDAQEGSATRGLLIIDEEKLNEALDNDLQAVAELFAADFEGDTKVDSGNFTFYNHLGGTTTAGSYEVSYVSNGSNIVSATINGKPASIDNSSGRTFITATADGDPAKGLSFEVLDTTTSGSGSISLLQGKAGEMADLLADLTSSSTGPLSILENNYKDIIKNIESKIEREETRLAMMEQHYKEKFARLEATLGSYNNIASSLDNQIAQMNK